MINHRVVWDQRKCWIKNCFPVHLFTEDREQMQVRYNKYSENKYPLKAIFIPHLMRRDMFLGALSLPIAFGHDMVPVGNVSYVQPWGGPLFMLHNAKHVRDLRLLWRAWPSWYRNTAGWFPLLAAAIPQLPWLVLHALLSTMTVMYKSFCTLLLLLLRWIDPQLIQSLPR